MDDPTLNIIKFVKNLIWISHDNIRSVILNIFKHEEEEDEEDDEVEEEVDEVEEEVEEEEEEDMNEPMSWSGLGAGQRQP